MFAMVELIVTFVGALFFLFVCGAAIWFVLAILWNLVQAIFVLCVMIVAGIVRLCTTIHARLRPRRIIRRKDIIYVATQD